MGDPLSVSAGVAGLISLGIQVSQALITYYTAYRDQDANIAKTTLKLEGLLDLFVGLDRVISTRHFHVNEQAVVANIESSIGSCDDLIHELEQELEKFRDVSHTGIKYIVKTAGRRLAYPFRKSTLQKMDEDISDVRDNLALAINVLQLSDNRTIQADVADLRLVLDLVRASQISHEIRDWLKAPDPSSNHNTACGKTHAATGRWFVKGSAFTEWLEGNNSFLWLNGFAGCGKTVLCSTAIQHTFRHRQSNAQIGIAFFYFSFTDSSKQYISGLLRSVLLQLSSQTNDNQVDLNRFHTDYKNGEPPAYVLLEYVRQLVGKFEDVYLLVDAIDESPGDGARENVLQTLTEMRAWSLPGFHILVTSRDLPDIREQFDPSSNEDISMKNAGVDQDINGFICEHLAQSPTLKKWRKWAQWPQQSSRIRDTLAAKAGGVFRWVECQLRSLISCPRSEDHLEKLLNSLPPSLDATYERMLLQINDVSIKYARRLLMWLCFSKRPLSVPELIDAIAVDIDENPKLNRRCRLQDENDLLQICPGLINISFDPHYRSDIVLWQKPANVVSIEHYSVQEYLESDQICQQQAAAFSVARIKSNVEIAQTCLIYLSDPMLSEVDLLPANLDELPLAQYAARYWYEHATTDEISFSQILPFAIQLFSDQGHRFQNYIRISNPEMPRRMPLETDADRVASPLYYASLLGLSPMLSKLCDGAEVNAQGGGRYGNALQAASAEGHEAVVQRLLERGAEVNAQGGYYGNALQAASAEGHEAVVQRLLERGAEVNAQGGGRYGNALQAASAEGHEAVVQRLLERGAEVNAQGGGRYGNALQAASAGGHEAVVQRLLEHGAEVNAQGGGRYGNALQAASAGGHEAVVQRLLEHGAEVNAQGGGYYVNALQAASAGGHEAVVQRLLEARRRG